MRLEASPTSLTLRLEVHVDAASAVPLPGVAKEWSPTEVAVDGNAGAKPAPAKAKVAAPVAASSGGAALTRTADGRLWVAWPKKASGVATDVSENNVRQIGLDAGLVDVKVCAINDVWSGLKFVFRLKDRAHVRPSH
jgi:hypothetical protein